MFNLYKRIELLSGERGITQMCKDAKITRSILTELKSGRTMSLSSETLAKIADLYNIPMSYFYEKPPFDHWEAILDDRENFFYTIPAPYDVLKKYWGIDKDNVKKADVKQLIRFLDQCFDHVDLYDHGDWDIYLKREFEFVWRKEIVNEITNEGQQKTPPIPDGKSELINEIIRELAALPQDKQQEVLRYIRFVKNE